MACAGLKLRPVWYVAAALMSLLGLSAIAQADTATSELEGALSAELKSRFVMNLQSSESRPVQSLHLPMSKARKVNGRWGHKKQLNLALATHLQTHQLERDVDLSQVWTALIQTANAKTLFECQGLACGSSSQWANGVFGIKQLYGPDRGQHYWLARFEVNDSVMYLQAYLIRRGNQAIYLHLRYLSPELLHASTSDTLTTSYLYQALSHTDLAKKSMLAPEQIQFLRTFLTQKPQHNIYLVGHAYPLLDSPAATHELKSLSLQQAIKVQQWLLDKGLAKERLHAYGVGDLAPQARTPKQANRARVEIVLQQP